MKKIMISLILCLLTGITFSQNSMFAAYGNQDYKECIRLANEALDTDPNDKTAHFLKGAAHNNLQEYKLAEKHLNQAEKLGHTPIISVWAHILRSYAGQKRTKLLLSKLEEVASQGFSALIVLGLPEFSYLSQNDEFLALQKKVEENAFPCKGSSDHRRFDFWIGNWDVYANGRKIAKSKISYSHGDCAVLEDYQTLGAIAGNSLSHYDSATKKWMQTYADHAGRVSYYIESEEPYEGNLQFISKATAQGGQLVESPWIKMTYSKNEDGSVRQFMESSNDQGASWSPMFDGLYKKASNEKR